MTELLLACRDCGQIHQAAGPLAGGARMACVRCDGALAGLPQGGLDRALAYAVAALLLFVVANAYPIFIVYIEGAERHDLLITGALQLVGYGGAMAALGVLVALLSIIMPAMRLGLVVVVLGGLKFGSGLTAGWLAAAWKVANHLRPWSMLDVYLLGAFVAYTRLHEIVDTTIGIGGYALAALVIVQALLQLSLGRRFIWDQIGDPRPFAPGVGEAWMTCPDCQLVTAAPAPGADGRCPRCATRLAPRRRSGTAVVAALTITACILYVPANLLPVMTILHLGRTETNTILSGVGELDALGMWPLALLVLFASIIVPVLKLVTLSWFLIATRWRWRRLLRQRTAFYRLIEFVGRWSNIDVFMVSILATLLQFGELTTVDPNDGIVSFAAVVALTMIATRLFDPRMMWDAAVEAPT